MFFTNDENKSNKMIEKIYCQQSNYGSADKK